MSKVSTLPQTCPRDGEPCRKEGCDLHVVDWRSNKEYCMMPEAPKEPEATRESEQPVEAESRGKSGSPGENKSKNMSFLDKVSGDYESWYWNE